MGRTRGELLYGSPEHGGFRPVTAIELIDWMALYHLEAEERRAAEK